VCECPSISSVGSNIRKWKRNQTTQFTKGRLSKFSARTRRLAREAIERPKRSLWRFSSREWEIMSQCKKKKRVV